MRRHPILMWTSIPVLLCFAISCRKNVGADTTGKTAPRAATSTFKVIGYLPSWSGSVSAVQFSKLTHINYAFLIPNSDGSLQAIDDASKLQSMAAAGGRWFCKHCRECCEHDQFRE